MKYSAKQTVFTKEDMAVFLDESPNKKFTTTNLVAAFNVAATTIHDWSDALISDGLIKREKQGRHWVYFSKEIEIIPVVQHIGQLAQPRKLFCNPMNKQNWSAVTDRIRTDLNRVNLGNFRELSPFQAA